MLARPEVGTREHIKLWVGGRADKDPNEVYNWSNSYDCPCGQYSREHYGANFTWMSDPRCPPVLGRELNRIASDYRTFGALYAGLCARGW